MNLKPIETKLLIFITIITNEFNRSIDFVGSE